MKVVDIKKVEPNISLMKTIQLVAEAVMSGEIQALGFAWLDDAGGAGHCYVPSEQDVDERLLLSELHLLTMDTTLSIASTDPQTFASRLLTNEDMG